MVFEFGQIPDDFAEGNLDKFIEFESVDELLEWLNAVTSNNKPDPRASIAAEWGEPQGWRA